MDGHAQFEGARRVDGRSQAGDGAAPAQPGAAPLLGRRALLVLTAAAAALVAAVLAGVPPVTILLVLFFAVPAAALVVLALKPSWFDNPFLVVGGVMSFTAALAALEGRRGGRERRALRRHTRDGSKLIGDPRSEREYALGLTGVFGSEAERQRYLDDGWERIQVVLRLLEDLHARGVRRVLELGANPYLLTVLMKRRFDFDLELANYFGEGAHAGGAATHAAQLNGSPLELRFRHFNIESDAFPYEAASFDAVLFCEILEHLLLSPDRAMAEIARVVRPGGYVVVSTPNATRLMNLYSLALGRSIWDGYSSYGPYGRHNREYSLGEVEELMARHGFAVDQAEVRNLLPAEARIAVLQRLRPDVWYDHLFVVGRKTAPGR